MVVLGHHRIPKPKTQNPKTQNPKPKNQNPKTKKYLSTQFILIIKLTLYYIENFFKVVYTILKISKRYRNSWKWVTNEKIEKSRNNFYGKIEND